MLDKKKFYINGEWVSPKKPNDFNVTDPSTEEGVQVPGLVEEAQQATQGRRQVVRAWGAYRATAAMEGLVLERLAPCFSCLSLDPHGSPLNPWMVARS